MASDLEPPLRGEPILDELGNFTIRYTEFFSRTAVLLNEVVNGGTVVNPANLSNSTVFGAQLIELQQRIGSGNPLTSDETGFTVDLDTLSVDMTEA